MLAQLYHHIIIMSLLPSLRPHPPPILCHQCLYLQTHLPLIYLLHHVHLINSILSTLKLKKPHHPFHGTNNKHNMITPARTKSLKPNFFLTNTISPPIPEPINIPQALNNPFLLNAMKNEFDALIRNNTCWL